MISYLYSGTEQSTQLSITEIELFEQNYRVTHKGCNFKVTVHYFRKIGWSSVL